LEKKLFFVMGPESSGTRLTTKILCESGCFGDFEHYQRLDEFVDNNIKLGDITNSNLLVFRRSIPHGNYFPDILKIVDDFSNFEFDIYIIITVRNCYELCLSKIKNNGKLDIQDAYKSFQMEMKHICNYSYLYDSILYFDTSLLFKYPDLVLDNLKDFTKLEILVDKVKKFLYDADINYYGEKNE
jgi:hypothetical protein